MWSEWNIRNWDFRKHAIPTDDEERSGVVVGLGRKIPSQGIRATHPMLSMFLFRDMRIEATVIKMKTVLSEELIPR